MNPRHHAPTRQLLIERLNASYGDGSVLCDLSLGVAAGEIVCLCGRNGAGKTTLLRAIMGLLPWRTGRLTFNQQELSRRPAHKIAALGIGYVPQGRRLFGDLTVAQNLAIGLHAGGHGLARREPILTRFPVLRPRLTQRAATLSGGEQQLLAIARALCIKPALLLMDEPTEGLMPMMIVTIHNLIRELADDGVAILLVEQRRETILALPDRVVFIENGRITATHTAQELNQNPTLLDRHLGVTAYAAPPVGGP